MQEFQTCFTNTLIGCSLRNDELSERSLIVRIYGQGTEIFINRQQEMYNMILLHAAGSCEAQLICKFKNGIVYGYLPGVMLNCHLVFQPPVERYLICGNGKRDTYMYAGHISVFSNVLFYLT